MNKIAKSLKKFPNSGLRSINLSYNTFDFDMTRALMDNKNVLTLDNNVLESLRFIQNMIEYISKSQTINHLDISGMGFHTEFG